MKESKIVWWDCFRVSGGWMGTVWTSRGVRSVTFPRRSFSDARRATISAVSPLEGRWMKRRMPWRNQLSGLAKGVRGSPVRLDLVGTPPFSRSVWKVTASIPRGQTRSYQWVARRLGSPRAMQAVGQALKRNPVPLLVPCHRVIRASGQLGGFSGGRGWKRKLLEAEGAI